MISRMIPPILSRISPGAKLIVVSDREPAMHERAAGGNPPDPSGQRDGDRHRAPRAVRRGDVDRPRLGVRLPAGRPSSWSPRFTTG